MVMLLLQSKMKSRLDQLLVARGLAESRAKAQAMLISGNVLVNDVPVTKAGIQVADDVAIRLKNPPPDFVSRGGIKLKHALDVFGIDPAGKICLDVGMSTGGFTDCLLKHGAVKVYGVDVGYAQTHWSLQSDARVVLFERENFRNFDLKRIPERVDIAVMDVSFISVKLLIPKIAAIFRRDPGRHELIVLVKPQFEAGREHVGKGGIVRDESARLQALTSVKEFLTTAGFSDIRDTPSPITGTDGNVEYLVAGK